MRKFCLFFVVLYAVTCRTASADSFKFEATVSGFRTVDGFDVNPGDTISGTFGYGIPGESGPFIQAVIDGVEYSTHTITRGFLLYSDTEEGEFIGIGTASTINAQIGIFMQGSGQEIIAHLLGCDPISDVGCPGVISTFNLANGLPANISLPTSFPFLRDGALAAELQIRSDSGYFGYPVDPGSFEPYYLNADITSITAVPEPPAFALLMVGLVSFLWLSTRRSRVRISR